MLVHQIVKSRALRFGDTDGQTLETYDRFMNYRSDYWNKFLLHGRNGKVFCVANTIENAVSDTSYIF